jgi:hypothetical protein
MSEAMGSPGIEIATPFIFDTTPLFRLYAVWRLAWLSRQQPEDLQRRQLMSLVRLAENTRFGRAHGFDGIRSVADFQAAVPLRHYEDFWGEWWQRDFPRLTDVSWPGTVPFYALTSGTTTGVTKYIPCTHEMNASNRKVTADLVSYHLSNRPRSRLLGGQNFMLGGSTDLRELAPGVYAGDLSGITAGVIPWWARPRYFPPRELEYLTDWEEKIARLAPLSLHQDIRSISGMPNWLLILFDRIAGLRRQAPHRLVDYWPNLELVVHGGVNFAPYRSLFWEWLEESHAETREVYAASEGFLAVADRDDGEGMRLSLDAGLFYEFVPLEELEVDNPTRHWIGTVEPDVNYAVVVSTCAGLWSYVLGDTVRFVDLDPPRVLVTGRVSYGLSAFGEHLIDEEIENAVTQAAANIGERVVDYAVGAAFPGEGEPVGGHLYIVEFTRKLPEPGALASFVDKLDAALSETNEDYAAHRAGDFGLRAPRVQAVAPGTFARWMKARGQLGGQHKVPRVINDPELFENLCNFVGSKER